MSDPLVDSVVSTIAQAVGPEKIVLFGSRARGTGRPNSDLDLAIIYSGPMSKRDLKIRIRRLFPKYDFSVDLFVLTPEEYESSCRVANTLARELAERGIVCYG